MKRQNIRHPRVRCGVRFSKELLFSTIAPCTCTHVHMWYAHTILAASEAAFGRVANDHQQGHRLAPAVCGMALQLLRSNCRSQSCIMELKCFYCNCRASLARYPEICRFISWKGARWYSKVLYIIAIFVLFFRNVFL